MPRSNEAVNRDHPERPEQPARVGIRYRLTGERMGVAVEHIEHRVATARGSGVARRQVDRNGYPGRILVEVGRDGGGIDGIDNQAPDRCTCSIWRARTRS
jgi:hypothetical protein